MASDGQETEAKFFVQHLHAVEVRLHELGASMQQPRVLEINLRFDLPDGSLHSQGRVLRLRRDAQARLTYKGASQNKSRVLGRQEIEFVVGDFEKAKQLLEALGFQQFMVYEKYRATYELGNTQVMLDELPYGNFVEIEGETEDQIRSLAEKLHLDWEAAIGESYTVLFEHVRQAVGLAFHDLTFENFEGIKVTPAHLRVRAADE